MTQLLTVAARRHCWLSGCLAVDYIYAIRTGGLANCHAYATGRVITVRTDNTDVKGTAYAVNYGYPIPSRESSLAYQ